MTDDVALMKNFFQQFPFAARPFDHIIPDLTREFAKILLDLAKIRQNRPRRAFRLQEPLLDLNLVQTRLHHTAALKLIQLRHDLFLLLQKPCPAMSNVRIRLPRDLMEQIEYRAQTGLRADKILLMQADEPLHGFLRRRGQIIIPFLTVLIFPQPAMAAVRPDFQIILRRTPESLPLRLTLRVVQKEIQPLQKLLRLNAAPFPRDEFPIKKRGNKRSLIRGQKPPGCVVLTQISQITIGHIFRYICQTSFLPAFRHFNRSSSCFPIRIVVMIINSGRT